VWIDVSRCVSMCLDVTTAATTAATMATTTATAASTITATTRIVFSIHCDDHQVRDGNHPICGNNHHVLEPQPQPQPTPTSAGWNTMRCSVVRCRAVHPAPMSI
ncbi:uncharacterized protein BJ171DRAFT_504910, partial [Polychytrium aggregatum]|uniref:uncharacterized protein n=1 Tax=Polychytrium aggregatum TaxID=110093 RepID=UPI0022FE8290